MLRMSGLLGQLTQVNVLSAFSIGNSTILACQLSSDWTYAGEMDDNIKLEMAFHHQENTKVTLTWAQLQDLDIHTGDVLHVSCYGGKI